MARNNLTIPQGATWAMGWPITQDDEPVDLAGWSAKAHVRATPDADTVLHEWSTAEGNISLSGSMVTLLLEPADSSAWDWTAGVYDLELTDTDGTVWRIGEGAVYVQPEVTR